MRSNQLFAQMLHSSRVDDIKQKFNMLQEKDFFSFASIANSSNRFRKAMYEYCVNNLTREKLLKSNRADALFFQLVEENKPTRALARALNGVENALEDIFALSVARSKENEDDVLAQARVTRYRKLVSVATCIFSLLLILASAHFLFRQLLCGRKRRLTFDLDRTHTSWICRISKNATRPALRSFAS